MAKLGDLVVRIGADTRDLNKSLGKVQRNMRSMTSNFTALGQQMTRAITLPILGVGAMAIKSAADLEKLEVSFISLTGGAKQAADMMKQLNEFTAKTPFQIESVADAAKKLLASGSDISEVNNQLQFLGDIAATGGHRVEDLAAIFAKVNAKGKVELESLNQLIDRGIPIIEALSKATGALPGQFKVADVSVGLFNKTLASFSEEGGFANGAMQRLSQTASGKFSTALDGLKLAGAALAEDLLPPVNALLDGIINLAAKFTALSDSTKRIIIVVGTFLATLGPLLIVLPKIVAGISGMRGAIIGMNIALAANPIVLASIAIAALTAAVVGYNLAATSAINNTKSWRSQLIYLSDDEARRRLKSGLVDTVEPMIKMLEAKVQDTEAKLKEARGRERQRLNRSLTAAKQDLDRWLTEKTKITDELTALDEKALSGGEGGFKKATEDVKIFNSEIDRLLVSLNQAPSGANSLLSFLDDFQVKAVEVTDTIKESFTTLADTINTEINRGVSAMISGLALMVGAAIGAQEPIKNIGAFLGETLAQMAINIGQYAITHGTAIEAIKKSLQSLNGILAIGAGVALIALGSMMKSTIKRNAEAAGVPALAEGGLAYGPTLAMVGDNAGASVDPEVIAPLSKLEKMMGSTSIQVYGRISGDDIVISNNRASRDRNRF